MQSSYHYSTRLIDRLAYAHDAGLYRVIPKGVARPKNSDEVIQLLAVAVDTKTPITFRSAGTSLSGQSVGPGIIAETVRGWKKVMVGEHGNSIRLQPGVIGAEANSLLAPYHRKIGPDPASINSCMIGGIIANNSSGMVCGTEFNAYHTMKSMKFILINGNEYDTGQREDYERFVTIETEISHELARCRKLIMGKPYLRNRIRKKYKLKNTMGYGLNAFLDYEHPLDIFSHLLIGSEGTLAFISEVELATVADPPFKTTGLLLYDSMEKACSAIPYFIDQNAQSLEVMDYASLTTAKYLSNPLFDPGSLSDSHTGLLCEFQRESEGELRKISTFVQEKIHKIGGEELCSFTQNAEKRDDLWKLRKGLYPTVGSLRKKGTSVITEDICVPYIHLPEMVNELKHIFRKWHFNDAVIFGHAKDGNLHFVSSLDMNDKDGVTKLDGMMQDLSMLTVVKFDGSLKAEHGTGRNMAPFVETEWGSDLYEIMWKIKMSADPHNILNPGVLLNKNLNIHISNIKSLPLVHDEVDLCVECGFCESVCPSRDFTMTPRHRIALAREMQLNSWSDNELAELKKDYIYAGEKTCATDGLCAMACPVNIDTGIFIKNLRSYNHLFLGEITANFSARYFSFVQFLIRTMLEVGEFIGSALMIKLTGGIRKLTSSNFSQWHPNLPGASHKISKINTGEGEPYIYFPSCVQRSMGSPTNNKSTVNMLREIAPILGIELLIPKSINQLCCGMPFSSKGFTTAHLMMVRKTVSMLYELTDKGKIPVLIDMSPCFYHFLSLKKSVPNELKQTLDKINFIDIIQFFTEMRGRFPSREKLSKEILIHIPCSIQTLNQSDDFISIIKETSANVILPKTEGCCGMAGDRGLIIPGLAETASQNCAASYPKIPTNSAGVSSSRMCEMSMSQATNVDFYSIVELVYKYIMAIRD